VPIDIRPEPSPEEEAAIVIALERLDSGREGAPDRWWAAGVRESVEGEDDQAV
jgi:hypothetical protein